MPLILGEFEARQRDPDAYAAFLNLEGFITESTSANILLVRGDRIYSPRRHGILEGISRSAVFGLARRIGKVMVEDDLTVFDAMNADEVLLTATSFCVLPVCQFDGVSIGEGKPGPTSQVLLEAWSAEVGVDIVGQALAHLPGSGARPEFDAGAVR
jgi:branched-subunit amino acid aminotransferase/4-amino-4-deoxychorismate lyase